MLCSTQQNLIFQHYYQSYHNYLLSLGRMDGEQAVFELLIISDFKKWSSTALKTLNNYTIIMTSNTNNSDKIRLSWVWCLWVFSVAYFWVNSTGCSGEFLIVFKHFQNLQNLVLNIWRKNCISLALWALVSLKPYIKNNKKADRLCMKFSSNSNTSVQRCLYPLFQNQRAHSAALLFSKNISTLKTGSTK